MMNTEKRIHTDRPIREGYRYKDVRYGEVTVIAEDGKHVWFKRHDGVYRTSYRQAVQWLHEGPDWSMWTRWYCPPGW